jgi:hypothetical protein
LRIDGEQNCPDKDSKAHEFFNSEKGALIRKAFNKHYARLEVRVSLAIKSMNALGETLSIAVFSIN